MKKIELVGVQRLLNRVDNHIHLIISIQFGNLVAGTDSATLALFEVARTPRAFQFMDSDSSPLGVYASSQHGG